jgi:aspartate/methionine/tyrosine aminotransferase
VVVISTTHTSAWSTKPAVSKESLFASLLDLHPNVLAVKLDGPTRKTTSWGFRTGFITFGFQGATPAPVQSARSQSRRTRARLHSSASSIGQHLLLKAYASPDYAAQKQAKFEILRSRYERIREIFAAHPEYAGSFTPMPFNSGYFMCVKPLGVDPKCCGNTC